MLALGATAATRTREQAAGAKTLAKVRGSVTALAQAGRHIAWINTEASCGRFVQILTVPGARPVYLGSRRGRRCVLEGTTGVSGAIALSADGRVLWQGFDCGNTQCLVELFTAALRAPRTRRVAGMTFTYDPGSPNYVDPLPLPTGLAGTAILFYGLCDVQCSRPPGVYRLVGRRSRRLANVTSPVGLAVSGGRLAAVTNSPRCCNYMPAWSHDGTRIAWIYHGNLWTTRGDGTGDRELAAVASPPSRSDNARLASLPSWSPDDARLVFERVEGPAQRAVYRVDASGGGLRRLASGTSPSWSPDGTTIAFVRGNDVYAIDPEGGGETKLTTTARPTMGPLSWSSDSTRIAVARGGDINAVRADGSGETHLTTSAETEGQPAWSPDGAKIAFASGGIRVVDAEEPDNVVAHALWSLWKQLLAAVDETGTARLTSGPDGSPAWSPDSSRIAFVRGDHCCGGVGELWVVNADGSDLRRLTAVEELSLDSPQWAPDGSALIVGDWFSDACCIWPQDPGIRLISPVDGKATKVAPAGHAAVEIRNVVTGRLINRFSVDGHTRAIALASDYVALVVEHARRVRLELHNLDGSFRAAAAVPSSVRSLSASGRNVVFATGRVIRHLNATTGVVSTLAKARRTPVGPTIERRRVVWAENARGSARIQAVRAP
jgi:dipeptidyl aminopeptidase/acylaminoacyl peptidase